MFEMKADTSEDRMQNLVERFNLSNLASTFLRKTRLPVPVYRNLSREVGHSIKADV